MSDPAVIRHSAKPKLLNNDPVDFLGTLQVRLFKNNLGTVDPAVGNSQFTEVTDSGYAPATGVFGAATLNGSNQGQSVGAVVQQIFAHNAGDFTIYGAYATDPADSDEWVWAVVYSSPQLVTAPGQVNQNAPVALLDEFTP